MNGMTGVETAKFLRKQDKNCIIIFLTSSSEHMPDAFSCHAFEYIQKPFTTERIVQVMTEALETLPDKSQYMEIINNRQTVRVFLDEIVSAITNAHYLDITLLDGEKLHCRMTIFECLKQTGADSRFIHITKGIAVNAEHILEFENKCCIMENGSKFPVRVEIIVSCITFIIGVKKTIFSINLAEFPFHIAIISNDSVAGWVDEVNGIASAI